MAEFEPEISYYPTVYSLTKPKIGATELGGVIIEVHTVKVKDIYSERICKSSAPSGANPCIRDDCPQTKCPLFT